MSQVLAHDNLDDRREVHRLLGRLSPARRVAFVESCCRRAVLPGSATRPGVARRTRDLAERARTDSGADERLTLDLYFDLWLLASQYDFDLGEAFRRLEARVRRGGRPCSP